MEQTKLPARLVATTRTVKVTPEYQTQLEEALLPYFQKLEDWDTRIKAFKAKATAKGIDDTDIHNAGEGRKVIQQTRIAAVKVIDTFRKTIQDAMSDYKNADTLWLRAKQNVEADCKAFETELREIEETRIREEARIKAELKELRTEALLPYCDNPHIYPLGEMSEGDFQNLKAVLVEQYNKLQEAEEKMRKFEEMEKQEAALETERLRLENENLQRKQVRVRAILNAGATFNSINNAYEWLPAGSVADAELSTLDDATFEMIVGHAASSVKYHKEQESIRKQEAEKRWRARVEVIAPYSDIRWNGEEIFDYRTNAVVATYEQLITWSDAEYKKVITPYVKREIAQKEQDEIALAKIAKQETKDKEDRERREFRVQQLFAAGMAFDGEKYFHGDYSLTPNELDMIGDDEFEPIVSSIALRISNAKLEEAERKLKEVDEMNNVIFDDPIATAISATGSMKSRLTAWMGTLKFPEPPGEYTGKGLKEVKNMRDGFQTWILFVEERIQKL